MSSTSSSLPSSSSFTPLQFTGISQYSSDFQQILSRAVSIAQIPVDQLTDEQNTIMSEETTLSSLNTDVASVGSALQAIGQLGSGGALTATTSDSSIVTATATGATSPTSYTISDITSIASAASEISQSAYAPPSSGSSSSSSTLPTTVSSTGSMELVYGGTTYPITLTAAENNVAGVAAAITKLGVGVTASVLTPGSGDYLSVSADSPGATTLQLIDDPKGAANNILTSNNQGSNTVFDLNNIPVSTPDTTVSSLIPGVTLNFTGAVPASGESVNVNLAIDPSQISSALQNLVTVYNTLQGDMNDEYGTSGSILSGNNILDQINSALTSIVQYQGSGDMNNLANLGIEISDTGQMSLNTDTFSSLSTSQLSDAMSLLGSSTTGVGGLQQTFSQITDPVTGTAATQLQDWNTETQNLTDQINTDNASIELLQQTVNQELQAADASVADLQSQQSILTANLTSLSYVSYGYNSSSSTSNTI